MAKVRERQYRDGGFSGGAFYVRVVEKGAADTGAGDVEVPADTAEFGWRHETEAEAVEANQAPE